MKQKKHIRWLYEKNSKKFEKYGLSKIVVSGEFSFEQDLIYSRISSTKVGNSKVENFGSLTIDKKKYSR